MPQLKAGILIIGSLFWETDKYDRKRWRDGRLSVSAKQYVITHTRYGRISSSRDDTYTMVFSKSAAPSTAIVLPCKGLMQTPDDLFTEAEALAKAENLSGKSGWKDWGAVAVAWNPATPSARQFLKCWPEYFESRVHANCNVQTVSGSMEKPSVNHDGFLDIEWPICEDLGLPNDCDILLATANAPDLESDRSYPSSQKVAAEWLRAGNADYFKNNILNRITTADDPQIWHSLSKDTPPWIATGEYQRVATLLAEEDDN